MQKFRPDLAALPPAKRSTLLAINFAVLLMGYYQVKPLSRTLFITYIGSQSLPYIWIVTTLVLLCLMPFFRWRTPMLSAPLRVCASCITFILLLIIFRFILQSPTQTSVAAFYVLIDAYGILIIEQYWALFTYTHPTMRTQGWYGVLGGGALVGGLLGSAISGSLVQYAHLPSLELISVAGVFFFTFAVLSLFFNRYGLFSGSFETTNAYSEQKTDPFWSKRSTVILLVCLALFSQTVEPIVEFQYLAMLEASVQELSARTVYASYVFFFISLLAILLNVFLLPFIMGDSNPKRGLLSHPIALISIGSIVLLKGSLITMSAMKVADRGLAYSIARASRETLYGKFSNEGLYRLKVWIDVVGYRLFKIVGAVLILAVTEWWAISKTDAAFTLGLFLILFSFTAYLLILKLYPDSPHTK